MSAWKPSVLVVDGDDALRTALAAGLEENGFVVSVASSCGTARDTCGAANRFDALVIEAILPEGTAVAFLRALLDAHRPLVAVALTSLQFTDLAGFDACMMKPIDIPLLVRELRKRITGV